MKKHKLSKTQRCLSIELVLKFFGGLFNLTLSDVPILLLWAWLVSFQSGGLRGTLLLLKEGQIASFAVGSTAVWVRL